MKRMLGVVAGLALAGAMFSSTASAQEVREGMFVGVGVGAGSSGLSCEFCDDIDRSTGFSGLLRAGKAMSSQLLLGAEVSGFMGDLGEGDAVDMTNLFVMANGYYYPSASTPIHLKGGVGMARMSLKEGSFKATSTGLGVNVGAGYDFPMGRMSLTPYVNYLRQLSGKIKSGGETGEKVTMDVIQFGVSLNWY